MSGFIVTARGPAVRFAVHVQPRASRTEVDGVHGDALRVRVHAPPVDDAANRAVLELVAESLGVPLGQVRLVAGSASRRKLVEVDGVSTGDVIRLAAARVVPSRGGWPSRSRSR